MPRASGPPGHEPSHMYYVVENLSGSRDVQPSPAPRSTQFSSTVKTSFQPIGTPRRED